MHWLCASIQPDFDTLYTVYWQHVVRFCATHVTACPDGTAEEVAQDVFVTAHRALLEQRYRGDSALSTWLFGIARNLCAKVQRDTYRQTTPSAIRRLEREVAHLEHEVMRSSAEPMSARSSEDALVQHQLACAHAWLRRAQAQLQRHLQEEVHGVPTTAFDTADDLQESLAVIHDCFQRLARCDRQAYTLLSMHVMQGLSVRQLAEVQGVSRAVVHRHLTQAKVTLRRLYQSRLAEATPAARDPVHA